MDTYPPLVCAAECDLLKQRIAQAARGEAFMLLATATATTTVGSDEPNPFGGTTTDTTRDGLKTLLQMATVLTYASSLPAVKIGRFPLPAAGYPTLRQLHDWNRDFVTSSPTNKRYAPLVDEIDRALSFIRACGTNPRDVRPAEFFTCREAPREDAPPTSQTHNRPHDQPHNRPYDTAAHFIAINDVEHTRPDTVSSIGNPIGIKLTGDASVGDVLARLDKLAPTREPGRLTLLVRMAPQELRDKLPPLVEKLMAEGHHVAWLCDPDRDDADDPTDPRNLDRAIAELEAFFDVHRDLGTHPAGVRFDPTSSSWPLYLAFNLAERLRATS